MLRRVGRGADEAVGDAGPVASEYAENVSLRNAVDASVAVPELWLLVTERWSYGNFLFTYSFLSTFSCLICVLSFFFFSFFVLSFLIICLAMVSEILFRFGILRPIERGRYDLWGLMWVF